jgi:hypothetical protein
VRGSIQVDVLNLFVGAPSISPGPKDAPPLGPFVTPARDQLAIPTTHRVTGWEQNMKQAADCSDSIGSDTHRLASGSDRAKHDTTFLSVVLSCHTFSLYSRQPQERKPMPIDGSATQGNMDNSNFC